MPSYNNHPERATLTRFVSGFTPSGFIGRSALHNVSVASSSVQYRTVDKNDNVNADAKVGLRGEPQKGNTKSQLKSVGLTNYAFASEVSNQEIRDHQAQLGANLMQSETLLCREMVERAIEKEIASTLQNNANYSTGRKGNVANKWNTANGNPITDILTASGKFPGLYEANTLILGKDSWFALRVNAKAIEAVRGQRNGNAAQSGVISTEEFSSVIGMDVFIGDSSIWNGKDAILLHVNRQGNATMLHPNFAVGFSSGQYGVSLDDKPTHGAGGVREVAVYTSFALELVEKSAGGILEAVI